MDGGSIVAIIIAGIAALASILGPAIAKRLPGPADAREDQEVENNMLTNVAGKALEMFDRMKGLAETNNEALQQQVANLNAQVSSLNNTIQTQQAIIHDLREDASRRGTETDERIALLQAEIVRLTAERDGLIVKIRHYEEISERTRVEIDETTITGAAASDIRATMKKE